MSTTLIPPQPNATKDTVHVLPVLQRGPHTIADWVAFEETKTRKHQLRNGEFIEMAGASFEHNVIAGNMAFSLRIQIEEAGIDCQVLGSDQRIFIAEHEGFYPDVVVFCGEPLVHPLADALQNPLLIVEVLSPSTAADDRGEKFALYRGRPTLRHYILIEQHRASVEHHQKGENGIWSLMGDHHRLEETLTVTLDTATVSIPLSTIYRRITFPNATVSA